MKRSAMIKTGAVPRDDGSFTVNLALADGVGDIMSMNVLAGSQAQADQMEKNFRKNAESLYNEIMTLLLNE